MSTMWGGIAGAVGKASEMARQQDQQAAQERDRALLAKLQRDALMAAASDRENSRNAPSYEFQQSDEGIVRIDKRTGKGELLTGPDGQPLGRKTKSDPVAEFVAKRRAEIENPLPQQPRAPILGTPEYLKAQEDIEAMRARHRPPPRGSAGSSRALPASAVEKLTGLDDIEQMATEVKDALEAAIKANNDVTGRAIGGLVKEPGWVMNARGKGGATGKDVRAMIGNLFATVAKERGGTALSEGELALLESYIPNKDEDEGSAFIKANRFIKAIQRMKKNKLAGYQKYGYGVDDEAPLVDRLETNNDPEFDALMAKAQQRRKRP
jgi:hypothetical protein